MAPTDVFFLYNHAGGLVIGAESTTMGAKLTMQRKLTSNDPQAGLQQFVLRGGVMTHQASGYVVDYREGTVMLWQYEPDRPQQIWHIDEQGKVTTPAVPNQVMRATRSNMQQNFYSPGAQVILAGDTPWYPDEGVQFRRYFQLWPSELRPLFNLAGSVMGLSPASAEVSNGSAGQLWFHSQGMFVNDAAQGQGLAANDYGGGRPYRVPGLAYPFSPGGGGWMQYQVDESATRIGNANSNTYFVYLPHAGQGTNEMWPAGHGDMDYRWCFGSAPQFRRVPGDFIDLSVGSDGIVAAVTLDNRLVYYTGGNRWATVPGDPAGVVDVAVGNSTNIWILDAQGRMRRFTGVAPDFWTPVTGPLMASLSVAQTGAAWGIDISANIQRRVAGGSGWEIVTPQWQSTTGHLDQISLTSESDVWATGKDGKIWWYDPDRAAWEQVPGTLDRVSTGADGSAWGVTDKSLTYEYVLEPESWAQHKALFSRLSVGSAIYVWALGPGGTYQYDPYAESEPTPKHTAGQPPSKHGLGAGDEPANFAPTASDVNEAILCGNLAKAAYQSDQSVREAIANLGYTAFRFFHDVRTGTDGFLAYDDSTHSVALVFRGTESMQDVSQDLWQEMVPMPELGPDVMIVEGFDVAYTAIEDQVMAAVNELLTSSRLSALKNFYVTGHSLGGALATIGALQMAMLLFQRRQTKLVKGITFAAPAIGNPAFRNQYLSRARQFAAVAYVDQNDSVATGKWTVAPGVVIDLRAMGYVPPVPSIYVFDDDTPMPECHYMDTYLRLLNELAQRTGAIREIMVEITTGTGSVAPWFKFDTPGTSREISVTLGRRLATGGNAGGRIQQILRPADNAWLTTGAGFETGERTTFRFNNTLGLVQADLQELIVHIEISASGLFNWDVDNWNLDGVKIIADGIERYNRQNMNRLMGPDYTETFTDTIPPLP